jgi:hypothetical protein
MLIKVGKLGLAALLATALYPGCSASGGDVSDNGKADTPAGQNAVTTCKTREAEALKEGFSAYVPGSPSDAFGYIRWACQDVPGVNTANTQGHCKDPVLGLPLPNCDERGQEYCEYYAVVQPPPLTQQDDTAKQRPPAEILGQPLAQGATSAALTALNEFQSGWLEEHPGESVGKCVFTSWHQDIDVAPTCTTNGSCPTIKDVFGFDIEDFALNAWNFKMKVGFNSGAAARDLVQKCSADGVPVCEDDYMRGCLKDWDLYGTEWRRSDPTICAGALRAAKCGCGVKDHPELTLDEALVPTPLCRGTGKAPEKCQWNNEGKLVNGPMVSADLRGFALGTWEGAHKLPPGCEYVKDAAQGANGSQTIVVCKLTTDDLAEAGAVEDVKEICRKKYAFNVVVHIPIPVAALECTGAAPECKDQPTVIKAPTPEQAATCDGLEEEFSKDQ